MCNSLNPASWYEQNDDFDREQLVILANPLSSDLNAMRQSLLFGGLNSVIWNINRQNLNLKLYEFGCYFYHKSGQSFPKADDYIEKASLDLFITGNTGTQSWNYRTNPSDFFHIKSAIEMIFSRLGVKPGTLITGETHNKYFAEAITYTFNNKIVAEAGRISKNYLAKFDIGQDLYYGHIEWDHLMKLIKNHTISFRELPKYPSVRRDLALLLDKGIKFGQIRDIAFHTEKNILQEVSLFDVYESDSLGKNKKSYAVSFILRDDIKTMTDKNIDKIMSNLIKAYENELDAQIR